MIKKLPLLLTVAIILLIVSACSSSKVYRLMQDGEVAQSGYKVEIPFEMKLGLIILKVRIQGADYDFLFDTGAPNVVTNELAAKLKLKPVGQNQTKGSQGHREKVDYAYIDTLSIGGIQYIQTGTGIMNFNRSNEISCMEIDGILGANTMRNSIWQIDYQKQIMTIVSHIDSLTFTANLDTIPFTTKTTGTPVIDINVGSVVQHYVTLDLGSSGHIDLSDKMFNEILKKEPDMPKNFAYGNSSSGIYGVGAPDTINYFKPDSIQFGSVQLANQICHASVKKTSSTLGTRFFENYIITLDWTQKHVILDKVKEYDHSEMANLGYSKLLYDGKLKVAKIYNGTEAANQLQLFDEVIQEDSLSYVLIQKADYCKMILDTANRKPLSKELIIERAGQKITVPLIRETFLK